MCSTKKGFHAALPAKLSYEVGGERQCYQQGDQLHLHEPEYLKREQINGLFVLN